MFYAQVKFLIYTLLLKPVLGAIRPTTNWSPRLPVNEWLDIFSICHVTLIGKSTNTFHTLENNFPIATSQSLIPVNLLAADLVTPLPNETWRRYPWFDTHPSILKHSVHCYSFLIAERASPGSEEFNPGLIFSFLYLRSGVPDAERLYIHALMAQNEMGATFNALGAWTRMNFTQKLRVDLTRFAVFLTFTFGNMEKLAIIVSLCILCPKIPFKIQPVADLFLRQDGPELVRQLVEKHRTEFLPQLTALVKLPSQYLTVEETPEEPLESQLSFNQATIIRHIIQHCGNQTLNLRPGKKLTNGRIPSITALSIDYGSYMEVDFQTVFMPSQDDFFNFLTCYKHPVKVSWDYLVTPFHLVVWLLLLVTAMALTVLLLLVTDTRKRRLENTALIVGSFFLENCQYSPTFSHKIGKGVLCLLIFTAFIFSNTYKGKITSNVTAPKPQDLFRTFTELVDEKFGIYSLFVPGGAKMYRRSVRELALQYPDLPIETVESAQKATLVQERVEFTDFWVQTIVVNSTATTIQKYDAQSPGFLQWYKKQILVLNSITNRIKPWVVQDADMWALLSSCNKTALAFRQSMLVNLVASEMELEERGIKEIPGFYQGEAQLLKRPVGWMVKYSRKNSGYLANILQRLALESGIFTWLRKQEGLQVLAEKNRKFKGRKWVLMERLLRPRQARPKALSLESNLFSSTIILYFFVLGFSILVLVGEICYDRIKKMMHKRAV